MHPAIITQRLLLRPLDEGDVDALVAELNDFAIVRNTARIPHPYHRDDALDFLSHARALDHRSLVAAITTRENPGDLLGVVSYEWSEAKGDAELGYWLATRAWGKRLGSEAAQAAVDHAFSINRHPQLVACYHTDNPHSGRILARLGFAVVGPCTSFSRAQGKDVAITNTRLTRADWASKKAAG